MDLFRYFSLGSLYIGPIGYAIIGVVLIILIILSGFFSASEIAYSTVNIVRLRSYVEEKKKGAKHALWVAEHFERTLTTILVGNNFVNIASTSLAAFVIANLIINPTLANVINIIGMTLIVLVFGEIIPKANAKKNAEKFALRYGTLMFFIIKILTPICAFFLWLQKIFTKKKNDDSPTVTEDELESIIDQMEEEGVIDSDDADLMQSVLDIGDRTIYDIMIPRVDIVGIDADSSIEEIKDIFFQYKFSRLPVYKEDKDHIIGILSERDFFTFLLQNSDNLDRFNINELITRPLYVSKTMKVDDLIRRMQIEKKHLAIVSDEYGGTSGIVTMEDALEEIVGEIYDEHDEKEDEIVELIKLDDKNYIVPADMNLDDLFEQLNLGDAPESSYTNVGGFLYSLAEEVPIEGDVFHYDATVYETVDEMVQEKIIHLEFKVLEVKERRIIKAKLTILDEQEEDEK